DGIRDLYVTGVQTCALPICLTWSNQAASYQAAMTDELGLTTLPVGDKDAYAIQMSQYLGINKDSKNKEAAALFINFFVTSPEAGDRKSTRLNSSHVEISYAV